MSRIANIATQANASLTSHRSTSSTDQPALSSTLRIAPTGAVVKSFGAWACAASATIVATGALPSFAATLARVSTSAAAPSEIELEVAAVIVPSLANAGLSCGILSGLPLPGASSVSTVTSPARVVTVTGAISSANAPEAIAAPARASDLDREGVHLLAGQLVFVGGVLREGAHRTARLVGILEPVEEHVIVGGVVADARARAVLLEQVGSIGHALHPARDDEVDRARGERLGAHDHRLHARAADLVDRGRLDRLGQAGLDRRLAGRGLAEPGGKHAAHVDAVDRLTRHAGALDGRLDRGRAEIGRGDVGQRALHRPHRGARVGQDDDRIGFGELGHDG